MHHSTVSRALRDDPSVNSETRKRVVEYASVEGYHINMSALQLRGSVKNTIAVLVPNIHHSLFSNVVSVIADLAFKNGYVVSVFQSNESSQQEKEIIKLLIQNNVAGVIASVSMETETTDHFKELLKYHIPLVLFDRICPGLSVPTVTINNFEIVSDAVDLLVRKGRTKIVHISGTRRVNVFRNRQDGYLSAIKKNNLGFVNGVLVEDGFTIESGKNAASTLLAEGERPDAIICDSQLIALGVISKIKELGLKIPDDICIVSFCDKPYIETFISGIISIVQPDEEIAGASYDLLMKIIDKQDNLKTESLLFSAKIVEN